MAKRTNKITLGMEEITSALVEYLATKGVPKDAEVKLPITEVYNCYNRFSGRVCNSAEITWTEEV